MNLLASREDAHSFMIANTRRENLFCTREKFSREVCRELPIVLRSEVQFTRSRSSYGANLSCEFVSSLRKMREMLLLGLFK